MLANKAMNFLHKKRKLAADQLNLPTSKHHCWIGSLPPRSPMSSGNLNGDAFAEEKSDIFTADLEPETKSAKDNNSCEGDPESMMPQQTSEYKVASIKVLQSSSPSGSFSNDSSNTMMVAATHEEPVNTDGDVEAVKNYDDTFLEFDSQPLSDYLYSAFGYYSVEQNHGNEIVENPGAENPILYSLSSGSWSISKEGERTTRKPTIDQEFEEYFSNLMLQ